MREHPGEVEKVVWSPDGNWLKATSRDGKVQLWDGHPLDCARGQNDCMWVALPRPEWHRTEAGKAFAAGRTVAALFHLDRASPRTGVRWLQRGQYALQALTTALVGEPQFVPTLLIAVLRPPGCDSKAVLMRAALLDAANDPRSTAMWLKLTRAEVRRLNRSQAPVESDLLTLACLQRLANDAATADATLAATAHRFLLSILSRDIAAALAARIDAPELRLTSALTTPRVWHEALGFDDYTTHGAVPIPYLIYRMIDSTHVALLRTRQHEKLFAGDRQFYTVDRLRWTTARTHLCFSIAHAQAGNMVSARAALVEADRRLFDSDRQLLGNMLLRREAVAAVAALETK